jgi:hypothetical protein
VSSNEEGGEGVADWLCPYLRSSHLARLLAISTVQRREAERRRSGHPPPLPKNCERER